MPARFSFSLGDTRRLWRIGTRRTFDAAHPPANVAAEPIKNPRRVIFVLIILPLMVLEIKVSGPTHGSAPASFPHPGPEGERNLSRNGLLNRGERMNSALSGLPSPRPSPRGRGEMLFFRSFPSYEKNGLSRGSVKIKNSLVHSGNGRGNHIIRPNRKVSRESIPAGGNIQPPAPVV